MCLLYKINKYLTYFPYWFDFLFWFDFAINELNVGKNSIYSEFY